MVETTTSNLKLTLPEVGGSANDWGSDLNRNFAVLDTLCAANMIVLWYGAAAACPTGWAICDGTNGTPNLSSRFVIGATADQGTASAAYPVFGSGGDTAAVVVGGHALSIDEMPQHNHAATDSGHAHAASQATHSHTVNETPHSHTATDGGHTHSIADHHHDMPVVVTNDAVSGGAYGISGGNLQIHLSGSFPLTGDTGLVTNGGSAVISVSSTSTGITLDNATPGVTVSTGSASIAVGNAGSGSAHAHGVTVSAVLPAYVALYYIMKLPLAA